MVERRPALLIARRDDQNLAPRDGQRPVNVRTGDPGQ